MAKQKETRISAKTLGAINMPDFCPRCFWIKEKCKQLPFQIFPGIFSSIDAYSKNMVHAHIDKHGHAPLSMYPALEGVTGYLPIPHWSKYKRLDPVTGITVSGVADGRLTIGSGSLIVPDYKTAKYTENADKLMPIYEAQLNGYRWIEEGLGNDVQSTPLIYCEPITDANPFDWAAFGFSMGFHVKVVQVEHKPDLVPNLLATAKEIIEMDKPPKGTDGCKDCSKLSKLVELVS
jgi:hypothetical protein